ncbi:hypothetical protein RJ639_042140 [Escallonia herrerae]|uniref:TLC domain-containing protein n=1 Tax=Escallonia herrerae TaxID=1293975 RepID=A0AA89B537_9ASTE|nr:hypothetical protein RJ639_042140 [Escallonia herrerae]
MGYLPISSASMDWNSESYPQYQDLVFLPFFVLLFPSVHFILDRFLFEQLARRLILGKGKAIQNYETSMKRKKLNKFKEASWKCIFSLSAEVALSVTYNEPWFTNTRFFWEGPADQVWPDQKMKLKLKGLYLFSAGFYMYSIFTLVFWETRRSDFKVSMGHHISTIILLLLSYIFKFARVGSVVLALHEGSDAFLQFGKISKYCGFERIAIFSFVLFVMSWLILRLIYYPFWILWSTSYEVLPLMNKAKHVLDGTLTCYYILNGLLFFLLACHIYWWRLMFRMLIKQIQ